MRRLLAGACAGLAGWLLALPALAVDDIVIPIDTVVRGDQGEVIVLVTVPVDAELQGLSCIVSATSENQESVHPDNDLVVSSGGNSVELLDVESGPFVTVTADEPLVLGDTITVAVRLGPDGVFSGGLTVTLDCTDETTTTTTTLATTTTTGATTTTTGETTTTGDTSTTTAPSGETTVTTVEPTTSTTETQVGGVTLSTTVSTVAQATLPFTGPAETLGSLTLLALGLVGIGAAMIRARRA